MRIHLDRRGFMWPFDTKRQSRSEADTNSIRKRATKVASGTRLIIHLKLENEVNLFDEMRKTNANWIGQVLSEIKKARWNTPESYFASFGRVKAEDSSYVLSSIEDIGKLIYHNRRQHPCMPRMDFQN